MNDTAEVDTFRYTCNNIFRAGEFSKSLHVQTVLRNKQYGFKQNTIQNLTNPLVLYVHLSSVLVILIEC